MNHFLLLVLLSLCISAVFAVISREGRDEQFRYFLTLLGYMVLGSLAAAWLMYFLPW